jgi:hypothetical protein
VFWLIWGNPFASNIVCSGYLFTGKLTSSVTRLGEFFHSYAHMFMYVLRAVSLKLQYFDKFWAWFYPQKNVMYKFRLKMGLGNIMGRIFFTNSSGRPAYIISRR